MKHSIDHGVLAIILCALTFAPAASHAALRVSGEINGLLAAVSKVASDDVCSKLNGKPSLSENEISATCEPGEEILCSCGITSNHGNSKLKDCKEYETGDSGRIACTCNDDGDGYRCESILGHSTAVIPVKKAITEGISFQ